MIIKSGFFTKKVVTVEDGKIKRDVFGFFGLFKKKDESESVDLADVGYLYKVQLLTLFCKKFAVELVTKDGSFYVPKISAAVADELYELVQKGGAKVGTHEYTYIPTKRSMKKITQGYTMLCDEYGKMIRKVYKKEANENDPLDLHNVSYFDEIVEQGIKGIAFGKLAGGGNANTIEIYGLKKEENKQIYDMVAANSPKLQQTDVKRYPSIFPLFSPSRWFKGREVLSVAPWGILHKQYGVVVNGRKYSSRTSVVEFDTIKSYTHEGFIFKYLEVLGATSVSTQEKFSITAKNAIWEEFKKRNIVNKAGVKYKAKLFHRKGQGYIMAADDTVSFKFGKSTDILPYKNVYSCEFKKPHWYSFSGTITIRGRRMDARAGEGGDITMSVSDMWFWKAKKLKRHVENSKG
jgi:uncharacterized protein (UPF0262 family)